MRAENISYEESGIQFEGYAAYPDNQKTPAPVVMIAPSWSGRDEFACNKARQLAELGYIGFALDVYGNAQCGNTKEECTALMQPLSNDRVLLLRRLQAAYSAAKNLDSSDKNRIAIIGYCFGGLCALDLARSGAELKGVVSFHGALTPPTWKASSIKAKILACHGYDDPQVVSSAVRDFEKEMTDASVDWQLHIYGHTMHAFTNPNANDKAFGTLYNATADKRSWTSAQQFFREIFA